MIAHWYVNKEWQTIAESYDDESLIDFIMRVRMKYPMIPINHIKIDDTPLMFIDTNPQPQRKARPTPVKEQLTQGQKEWRNRKKKRNMAERYRQHWIDKDNAKRDKKNPPPQP